MPLRHVIMGLASRKSVERLVRNSPMTRGVVRRFVAGETVEEAVSVAEGLVRQGFHVSLDLLGEHVSDSAEADEATGEYVRLLEAIASSPCYGGREPERTNISIKASHLGLNLNEDECAQRLLRILAQAERPWNFVRIDMEDSSMTDRTLCLARRAFEVHKNVGVVLQSMLRRTERDVEAMNIAGMRVRLVKGAYLEPREVAFQRKSEVNDAYRRCARVLLTSGVFPAIATHDTRLIEDVISFIGEKGIDSSRFEFQLLYGVRRSLQADLLKRGFNVRIYVPYGSSWYPYFTRRLAERPANLLFFLRSLFSR